MVDLNKLNSISTKNEKWLHEAKIRQKNKEWQKHSRKIASKILVTLREKNINKKQLAEIIGVNLQKINEIVKGEENLTLETISKLESALNINLFSKD